MSKPVVELSGSAEPASPKRRFATDAGGATSIEYALIAGLVFLGVVGSLRLYATKVGNVYTNIGNAITQN